VAADLPAITALGAELQAPHADRYPEIFVRSGMEDHWRKVLDAHDHAVFVAERGSSVIGVALAQLLDETSPNCHPMKLCRLNAIVVNEHARGTGAGRALIETVEAFARENGVTDIRLSVADFNESAIALYERMGYRIRAHVMGKLIGGSD
jgi:ribosomal protein S18 acetylase RimI-like enzyme